MKKAFLTYCFLISQTQKDDKESVVLTVSLFYICFMGQPITHKHILNKFGERMQRVRKSKDISQEKLAEMIAMDRTYIGLIERGERNPTIRTLYKIAKALKISSSDLLPF